MIILVKELNNENKENANRIFLGHDKNQYELEKISLVFDEKVYKFKSKVDILRKECSLSGTCNLVEIQEDGIFKYSYKNILVDNLNGNWILVDDKELNKHFEVIN